MNLENFTIVLAHPDDEVIFASSILKTAKKIIICFGESANEPNISRSRKTLYEKYPLRNISFLKIKESPRWQKMSYLPLLNPLETEYGINKGSSFEDKYKENFYKIYEALDSQLKNETTIVTHNPWGEYGHPEHIQVHRCICKLAAKFKFKVYVTGYGSGLSSELMYKTNHKISNFALIKNVEKSFFNKLKELYIYSGCWTWDTNYEPPSIEIFYLLNDYKIESKNLTKNEVIKVSKVPLNVINMNRPSSIQISANYLLPSSILKILQKIKGIIINLRRKNNKSIFKKLVFKLKTHFNLDTLNSNELKGNFNKITYIKIIKRTPLEVPFYLGRSARGISFNNQISKDPIFKLVKDVYEDKSFEEIMDNFSKTLKNESKLSISDLLGIKSKKLCKYPLWSAVLPWEEEDIEEKFKNYERTQFLNRKEKAIEYKFEHEISESDNIYSPEMAKSQILQTQSLFTSILKYGYQEKLGLPSFHILIKNNQWRWYMSQGNHRAYILYLLKNDYLLGTIDSIIRKNDVRKWHNVKNGLFKVDEAEKLFDYIFEGKKVIKPCI